MTKIIDLEDYRALFNQNNILNLSTEDREEIEAIEREVTKKYLELISRINKNLQFEGTEEQRIAIEQSTQTIIKSYEDVIVSAIRDIIRSKVEAYFSKKPC